MLHQFICKKFPEQPAKKKCILQLSSNSNENQSVWLSEAGPSNTGEYRWDDTVYLFSVVNHVEYKVIGV